MDAFAAVGARVSSVDEQRRLTILHVELGDLVGAKQGLSRELGAFLDAPSEAGWAKVSARLPVVMDRIRDIVADLRKEGEAGSVLAAEPVFKQLRSILETRKADVLCRIPASLPPASELSHLARLKAKLDEETKAMNAADDAFNVVIQNMRKKQP